MADVQDDDQWLYGDEKDEAREDGEINDKSSDPAEKETEEENVPESEAPMEESGDGGEEAAESEKNAENKEKEKENENEGEEKGEKEKDTENEGNEKEDGDDSSDEDDLTITIGVLKTQPDIIQAPTAPHQARFQPKPQTQNTGLKDDDFNSPGKVNGVPITEYSVADLEDKPWRKPGADISDYFNYGFNEESWFKYCERQKRMRINESGSGLNGLGICTPKPFGMTSNSISMTIVNDNSKYGGGGSQRPRAGPPPRNKGMGQIDVIGAPPGSTKTSTIQVMTADRRAYSSKVMMNGPPPPIPPTEPGYNDMEFGGNPYGDSYYPGDGPFYGEGGNFDSPPWGPPGVQPVPMGQPNWGDGPAPVPPPTITPVSSAPGYFEEEPPSAPPAPQEPEEERHRSRRSHRSRSRSPTRHSRHSSSRHARSRSRSPSHRHKRKKSKRERDAD